MVPESAVNPTPGGNIPSGRCLEYSETKIVDNLGNKIASSTCKDQLLFEEHFDNLKSSKWTTHEYFPWAPVSILVNRR